MALITQIKQEVREELGTCYLFHWPLELNSILWWLEKAIVDELQ